VGKWRVAVRYIFFSVPQRFNSLLCPKLIHLANLRRRTFGVNQHEDLIERHSSGRHGNSYVVGLATPLYISADFLDPDLFVVLNCSTTIWAMVTWCYRAAHSTAAAVVAKLETCAQRY